MKAATADGSTDVSEIIAGLDWIVAHRNDNGMNVRVINLSFGTDSPQSYQIDPLAKAAENAWRHGIVVVASAGNEGNSAGQLTDPAMDPYVLAVGATDPNLAVTGWQSPSVASFSNSGNATRSPDVVAPGKSIVSLRDPGSYIDTNHPEGLVLGDASQRLFRGSGTSQAAAVTSGGVALLAQAFPAATPDQLKAALTATAKKVFLAPTTLQGAGQISLNDAYNYLKALFPDKPTTTTTAKLVALKQTYTPSSGLGSLDAARGGSYLVDPSTGDRAVGRGGRAGLPVEPAGLDPSRSHQHRMGRRQLAGRAIQRRSLGEFQRPVDFGSLVRRPLVGSPLVRRGLGFRPLVGGPLVVGTLVKCPLVVGSLVIQCLGLAAGDGRRPSRPGCSRLAWHPWAPGWPLLRPPRAPIRTPLPASGLAAILAAAALYCIAELNLIHTEFRRQAYSFTLAGIPLVASLLLLPGRDAVVARVAGAAVAFAVQRPSLIKGAYNLSAYAFEVALDVLALHLLLGGAPAVSVVTGLTVLALAAASDSLMTVLVLVRHRLPSRKS